ncbi:AB hydrolase superfamily protein [Sparassis crispa]|uniref:AB hydrolase superfamily protein n=1 Tax=Sparassis crispa TaxID=139825 RepID=A0A401G9K1_9APHY|nr:AB hydrolase superfamily protein [Sparassis crispa]GBE78813.1 AB hydrolase superfamily protein [Sparassis crispa]
MAAEPERKVWQPIHPDFLDKLLPEYVAYHNEHIRYTPAAQQVPWDPSVRVKLQAGGASEPLQVGPGRDVSLSKCAMRVWTPEGAPPADGWPVLLFFHGGGWTLGTISTGTSFCTSMCKRANCLVFSVDYRLAPENPYPAAVEDAVEALEWVHTHGKAEFGANVLKIAVGGGSSGGNLAAVLTHKAALVNPPIPLCFQLLLVPVVDNTASESGEPYPSWRENAQTPWLSVTRMMWFRKLYLPNEADWASWDNSPIYASEALFAKAPPAWVAVMELDILRDEGIAYGEKLKKAGVPVEVKMYKRVPHQVMSMDVVHCIKVVSVLNRGTGHIKLP